jgi:hypothetical protein
MKIKLLTLSIIGAMQLPAGAYLSFTGLSISENFDSLGAGANTSATWLNNSTLPGWYAYQSNISGGAIWTNNSDDNWNLVVEYARSSGQFTQGRLLNLGSSTTSTNRALGSLSQDHDFAFALVLRNDSSTTLDSFSLSYYGEQWQQNASSSDPSMKLFFSYGVFSSFNSGSTSPNTIIPNRSGQPAEFYNGYSTAGGDLDFGALRFGSDTLPLDGDASANRQLRSSTQPVNWQPGEYLVLRWFDDYHFGETQAMLGIDDLQFTAVPEPSAASLLAAGVILSGLGLWIRRRKAALATTRQ